MFLDAFRTTASSVFEIFILAAIGYFMVKRNIINDTGLHALSRLLVEVTLPLMMFCELTRNFAFRLYPNWWVFPLLSFFITGIGLGIGFLFQKFVADKEEKMRFLALVGFQNSGYLPLALVGTLLNYNQVGSMFIYIFLFLLGFNLAIWSLGVYLLTFHKTKGFELGSLFTPPVIATVFSLVYVFLHLNQFTPPVIMKPLQMVGACTLPLAMFVVGGNLASINIGKIDKKLLSLIVGLKLILMPILGLLLVVIFGMKDLIGLLIVMQLAMPPATTLSVIMRHYHKDDILVSQGIFFGHIVSLITIPVVLGLYFMRLVVK